jgi:two-component system response regulator VicR
MPILMLTAHGDEADKVLGLELGADEYVTKPCSIRELTSRVRALLRRAYGEFAGEAASVLQAGDLRIDLDRTQVARGNALIDLTPIEYKLLVFLARHAGQSLSRAQLIENVWGYAADPDSERTVNVTVNRLRQKIERDPGTPALILTVPGVGYRMDDGGRR